MDEFYDFERMHCVADVDKKWCKFNKLIQGDPSSKVVLIAVPKNFDAKKLNDIQVDGATPKPFDIKKRIQKAEAKGTSHVKGFIESRSNPCIMEIHAGGQFEDSSHLRQIVTLLPKIQASANEGEPDSKNLELMSKGISAFLKVNVLPEETNFNQKEDPRLKNTIKQKMKTKRSMDEVSTTGSDDELAEVAKEEKPKKKKKSSKKWDHKDGYFLEDSI